MSNMKAIQWAILTKQECANDFKALISSNQTLSLEVFAFSQKLHVNHSILSLGWIAFSQKLHVNHSILSLGWIFYVCALDHHSLSWNFGTNTECWWYFSFNRSVPGWVFRWQSESLPVGRVPRLRWRAHVKHQAACWARRQQRYR